MVDGAGDGAPAGAVWLASGVVTAGLRAVRVDCLTSFLSSPPPPCLHRHPLHWTERILHQGARSLVNRHRRRYARGDVENLAVRQPQRQLIQFDDRFALLPTVPIVSLQANEDREVPDAQLRRRARKSSPVERRKLWKCRIRRRVRSAEPARELSFASAQDADVAASAWFSWFRFRVGHDAASPSRREVAEARR